MERHRDGIVLSTDPARLDLDAVHAVLREAYWSRGRPRAVLARAVRGSLCFGLYDGERQVGFARVVTDRATFAWLADVFVAASHQGRGLGRWLVESVLAHPDLQGLRLVLLATRDAHGLYEQLGFRPPSDPRRYLERRASPEALYGEDATG